MNISLHTFNGKEIAEVLSDNPVIQNIEDGIDLVGNLYFQGLDRVILHQKDIVPAFFDLKTGIAGEILQKFSTYRMHLAIVGDFSVVSGKSLRDFIFESNKLGRVNFVASTEEALEKLG